MCFSPEASFIAATGLILMGVATLRQTTNKNQRYLASLPILIGFQQFCEGIIWVGLSQPILPAFVMMLFKGLYFFYAFGFWPLWIPLSLLLIEKKPVNRRALWVFFGFGVLPFLKSLMALITFGGDVPVKVVSHSLQYFGESPVVGKDLIFDLSIYVALVVGPFLISSFPLMWINGVALFIAFIGASYFYFQTLYSVWCFLGAVCSVTLFFIFKNSCKR